MFNQFSLLPICNLLLCIPYVIPYQKNARRSCQVKSLACVFGVWTFVTHPNKCAKSIHVLDRANSKTCVLWLCLSITVHVKFTFTVAKLSFWKLITGNCTVVLRPCLSLLEFVENFTDWHVDTWEWSNYHRYFHFDWSNCVHAIEPLQVCSHLQQHHCKHLNNWELTLPLEVKSVHT